MAKVTRITTAQTRLIRHQVLRAGQAYATTLWTGDNDAGTAHLGAFIDTTLIGIVSLIIAAPPTSAVDAQLRLRGMAVLPNQRRKGIGNLLLDGCFQYAETQHYTGIWCNARVSALDFYNAYGFQIHGAMFEPPHIGPHYMMWKRV